MKARGVQWECTAHSPTPTFKNHVESTQNIVEEYSQTLYRLIPVSISRFSLYDFQWCYRINWYFVVNRSISENTNCVKTVGLRSFSDPYSDLIISTEYGEMGTVSQYSIRMRENMNQNNSEYQHFSRSDTKRYNHKNARTNGSLEALLSRFS